MGWVDNLDRDLNMDNQPGPSGHNPSITVTSEPVEDHEDTVEKENPYQVFSEKVTIAGLQEAYNSPRRSDKLMFRISLIAAFAAIIYLSITTADRYANLSDAVFDDKEIINRTTPFPNISICYPAFINETTYREMTEISKKTAGIFEMHNLSILDTYDFIRRVFFWDITPEDVRTPLYVATRLAWDDSMRKAAVNGRSMWEPSIPYCPSVLANCDLNGQMFDCCEMATPMTLWQTVCYHVGMTNKQNHITQSESRLSLDVSIDWATAFYPDNKTAEDGFHIFVDTIPSQVKVPISVPSQMDVWIVLAQPTRITERTGCLDEGKELTLFDYYDPHGVQCMNEESLNVLERMVGCHILAGSYFPINHSCSFGQNFALSLASSDVASTYKSKSYYAMKEIEKLKKVQFNIEESFRFLASDKSPCKQLCSRWEYPVFSVSYSLIMHRDFDAEKSPNRSWSRIKVILPHESYMRHNEMEMAMWYMELCDIGGIMGVYAGFSMITFAQILAYGIYVIWYKRNEKRPTAITEGSASNIPILVRIEEHPQWELEMQEIPNELPVDIPNVPPMNQKSSPQKRAQSKRTLTVQPKVQKNQNHKAKSVQSPSQAVPKKPDGRYANRSGRTVIHVKPYVSS